MSDVEDFDRPCSECGNVYFEPDGTCTGCGGR